MSLGVLSKSFGLAGLRIGWIATRDPDLYRRLVSFKHYLTICNSAPSELLGTIALRARERVLGRVRRIVEGNLAMLAELFERRPDLVRWARPRAGTVGFVRLTADARVEDFADRLVREESVMLLPGSVFHHPGNHFRVGFGRESMPSALALFERFADRYLAS